MLSQPRGQNMYISGAEEKKMFSIFQIFVSFQFSLGRSCEMWNMHDTPREHANTYDYESFWGQFSVFNLSKISQRFSIFSLPRSSSLWILYAFHFIRNVGSIHRFAFHFLILLRIRGTINQQTESSTHAHFHSLDFRLSTCSSRPPLFSSLLCVAIFRTIFESRKFIRRRLRSKTQALSRLWTFARVANLYDSNSDLMSPKFFFPSMKHAKAFNAVEMTLNCRRHERAARYERCRDSHTESLSTSVGSLVRIHFEFIQHFNCMHISND